MMRALALLLAATTAVPVLVLGAAEHGVAPAPPFNSSCVKAVSWQPRIFLYKAFLSDAECDHLVRLGKAKVRRSMVADNLSGKSVVSELRTSSDTFLDKSQDPVVSRIEERIAAWTLLFEENAENIQILRYEHGQKYKPHFDYFQDKVNLARGGHRYATVLMYLSTVDKGGETVFPNAKGWESQIKDDTFSECAQKGLAVKPVKGDAVLFFSLHVNGVPDPLSLHRTCPVKEGEKWSAPKWIHARSYEDSPVMEDEGAGGCTDKSKYCAQWAAAGQCQKKPVYMACPKSCRVCDSPVMEDEGAGGCTDKTKYCMQWAAAGQCRKKPVYMACPKSCRVCDSPVMEDEEAGGCTDKTKYCRQWAAAGQCRNKPVYMACPKSCRVCDS